MGMKQFVIWNNKEYLLFQSKNSGYLNISKLPYCCCTKFLSTYRNVTTSEPGTVTVYSATLNHFAMAFWLISFINIYFPGKLLLTCFFSDFNLPLAIGNTLILQVVHMYVLLSLRRKSCARSIHC